MTNTPVLFYHEGTCSLAPLISLIWLDRPFRLCRLENEEDFKNSDFLTLNPLGEVPLMYLDGTILTENVAILQHIGLTDFSRGITFKPGTPEFDQMNRALGFITSDFHKSFFPLFGVQSLHHDTKIQGEIKANMVHGPLRAMYEYVSDHLLHGDFIFDHPMIADAYLFATSRWGEHFFNIAKDFPKIKRFQTAMASDWAVKLALAIESGKQKDSIQNFLGHVEFISFVKEAVARKKEVDQANGVGAFAPGLKQESPEKESLLDEKQA